jgi:NRPS condensation-like uncharacterized protein
MVMNTKAEKYERKITHLERLFAHSPYAIVAVVARIKGDVSEKMLKQAVYKVQQRHQNLRARIKEDSNHDLWFTSEGVGEIPIEIIPRESEDHWIKVHQDACKDPFEFEKRPAIRFILVQSPAISELIILCHHIICDGMSLAYLARDLMIHLGDPEQDVEVLPAPAPIDLNNMPKEIKINFILKFIMKRINKKWDKEKIFFNQEDYISINEAYWEKYNHKMFSVELSEAQTSALVERCRQEGVTVNSALSTAFMGVQDIVMGHKPYNSYIGIAGNVRDRLPQPAGEVMGFFAGIVFAKYKYNEKIGFWDNTRKFHRSASPLFTNKNLFQNLSNVYLEQAILEAIKLKPLCGLVPPNSPGFEKLSGFSRRNDVVLSLLKRRKMESLDRIILGTVITNLTRLDFPGTYGALELDRLIMQPGSGIPLANLNLILGAVTCSDKLSLVLEYAEEAVGTETMEKIKDRALEFLLKD